MSTHVQCPHCGQTYVLTSDQAPRFAGTTINCEECGQRFLVPRKAALRQVERKLVYGEVIASEEDW